MSRTPSTPASGVAPGAGVLDALSLLAQVTDELVVRSVRDTHLAVADRVHGVTRRATFGASWVPEVAHRGIASAVYATIGVGVRAVGTGLDAAASIGVGPRLEATRRGRSLASTVNGLIGDRLLEERPQLAIPMAIRRLELDVEPDPGSLAAAFPDATDRVVVLLHGLFEDDASWERQREEHGTTYAESLAAVGWTPVVLRNNTGLPLRENGVALAALLQRLVDSWPTGVRRLALVGHSMGGLVIRAAGAVDAVDHPGEDSWTSLVTDVVTLGTPHLGAPVAQGVGHGSRGLARLPETATFGRILDQRSRGVHDLVVGLTDDVPALPNARYHLVAATLSGSTRHPVGRFVGDLLVRPPSAYGRDRGGRTLFPDADTLHVPHADHFDLLNHPDVTAALLRWLH